MKFGVLLLSLVYASPISPILSSIIPDQYIVVFKNDLTLESIQNHFKWLEKVLVPLLPKNSMFSVEQDSRKMELFSGASQGFWDFFGIMHKVLFETNL